MGGRLSNLQGHEDVERERSERRGQVPFGRHTPWRKGEVCIGTFHGLEHRLLAGKPLFLGSPLRRQVFVVLISERRRRRNGGDSPSIIDLGRDQEKDQKIGKAFHLYAHALIKATPTNLCNHISPLGLQPI